jgi:hypothetical protein
LVNGSPAIEFKTENITDILQDMKKRYFNSGQLSFTQRDKGYFIDRSAVSRADYAVAGDNLFDAMGAPAGNARQREYRRVQILRYA